jgi:hypothetical protein
MIFDKNKMNTIGDFKMIVSRRQFTQSLGASALLLPFFMRPRYVRAQAKKAPTRLIFITSLGVDYKTWLPSSAAGSPIAFGEKSYLLGLQPVLDKLILVGNLSGSIPSDNHGGKQDTTCLGNGDQNKVSLETYIANQLAPSTLFKAMYLGAGSKNESRFFDNNNSQPTIVSPLDAFNLAFSGTPSNENLKGFPPRKGILDINLQQIKSLQSRLGAGEKTKLDYHLTSMQTLESKLKAGASCNKAKAPDLMGIDVMKQESVSKVGSLQYDLIPKLLYCGVTNFIGFQWGITNTQPIICQNMGVPSSYASSTGDEHNAVHSGSVGENTILASEYFLASAFSRLIMELSTTEDPLDAGKSLLDNTIVYWTRDIGNGPMHSQESVPQVIAGGTSFFKYAPGGVFVDYKQNQGSTRRAMITIAQAMNAKPDGFGVRNGQPNTGDFNHPNGGNPINTKVLEEIMK